MKATKKLARKIAAEYPYTMAKWDWARDFADIRTQGELTTFQLNLLTDWIMSELHSVAMTGAPRP